MLPLWRFFIEKRQFTILVIIGLVLWGVMAVVSISKESSPEVQIPVGVVSVVMPGASAEDVERLVTNKLEEHLATLQDVDKITSVSRESLSVVTVTYLASANLDKSIQKLRDEVSKAQSDLPAEAKTAAVTDVNFANQPIQIVSVTSDVPYAQFAALSDDIKNELQAVPGVSSVSVSGVRNREIQVVVKKEQLASLGISLGQVIGALSAANSSLPIGAITVDNISYNIAFNGNLDNVSDIGGIAILNVNGQVIYLRDIADVSDGVEKANSYSRISVAGKPSEQAMTFAIMKTSGQDVTKVTQAVRAKLDELKKTKLLGSTVVITNDAGDQVGKDLSDLTKTGMETIVLVMLALLATLGWRESIIAGLSIPLSFLIAFIGLLYSGNTINFISLFSLILAIGILVDSGIVIVEAIHTRVRIYKDKEKAAIEALREYAWPLIGGTMTTVAVFFPLFFISGIVGKFIASIPYTLIFVLIASIFVALGLVPTLAILFAKEEHSALADKQEEYTQWAREKYGNFLRKFLHNRPQQNYFLGAMILGLVVAIAFPMIGVLKVTFFPQDDVPYLYIDMELPQGTALNQSDLVARSVEEALYDDLKVQKSTDSLITTVGESSSFSSSGGGQSDPRYANITVNLKDKKLRSMTSTQMVEEIKSKLATIHTATIRVGEPSGGPPVGAPVLIKFMGSDRDALDTAVAKARAVLEKTPGATDVDSSNKNEATEYTLSIDRGKLAQVGLTPAQVASTLRTAVSGTTATSLTGGTTDVNIVVSLNLNPAFVDPHDASRTTIDALRQIPIATPSGQSVLLGSVMTDGVGRSNTEIDHEARQRVVTLTANVASGKTVKEVFAAYDAQMAKVPLPAGITTSVGGEDQQTNQSFADMGLALLGGMALMFIILVLAFNSFRYTGYLIAIIPFSLIGVIGGLALTGQPLSFSSLLGVIALAGVIINHAIILVDAMIKRMHSGESHTLTDVVVESAVSRLRPIFLTTITTVIGMIPLTYVSALWGPLAFAIFFGLSFAMLLTLGLIPMLVYRWPGKLPEGVTRE